jgi:beta-lactamase regulating signal transducer with metallopeptidase domain
MTDTLVRVVGWTLIHSIWQGAIVVAVTATVLALMPRASARLRYAILCVALLTHLTAPIVTAVLIAPRASSTASAGGLTRMPDGKDRVQQDAAPAVTETSSAAIQTERPMPTRLTAKVKDLGESTERFFPWLAMFWLVGVGVSALRRVGGWMVLRRLIARATPAAVPVASRVAALARTMGIHRAVHVLVSSDVMGPFTSGWLRPVIVLPLSMLSGLDPVHVDAIVAHELAHIRRWDYLVAIIQSIALTVLFHHPATWWLDRRLRIEREYCCDDLAVLASRDRVGYVRALAELESQRMGLPSLALAATDGSLQHRAARLLGARSQTAALGWVPAAALLAIVVAAGALDAASVPDAQPVAPIPTQAPAPQPQTQQAGVIRHPDPSAPLEARFAWALDRAKLLDAGREVVIGWRIRSAVSDGRDVISSTDGTSRQPGRSVSEALDLLRGEARGVALLLKWSGGQNGELTGVRIRDLNSSALGRNDTFIWLDRADDSSSIALIQQLMARPGNSSIRSELGAALTLHDDRALVLNAATRVLDTERDEDVRAETMAWLGNQTSDPRIAALLSRAVDDSSPRVRDEALTALGDGKGGQPRLLELLRTSKYADVRSEAVQKLSGGGEDVVVLLLRVAFDDTEGAVQAEAVDAIKERSGSAATRALREIAQRHPDRRLRSEARDALDERGIR